MELGSAKSNCDILRHLLSLVSKESHCRKSMGPADL